MIDFNVKLGHWPYRPVKGLDAILSAMDANGVERAVISSLDAVFYLNPQDGNDALFDAVRRHRGRFTPFAVLKPQFSGWQDDLARCLDDYGMAGFVLYPNYHRFCLDDPKLAPLLDAAAQRRFPVCVQAGLEDPRRQYDREIVPDVPAADIGAFAQRYPEVAVVALGLKQGQPAAAGDPLPHNFYFDTSNYEKMGDLEDAVATYGAHKILLGSNMPLFNGLANIEKLRRADLTETGRQAIARENALALLGARSPG